MISPSPVAAAAPTVPSAYAPAPGIGESPTLLKECQQHQISLKLNLFFC